MIVEDTCAAAGTRPDDSPSLETVLEFVRPSRENRNLSSDQHVRLALVADALVLCMGELLEDYAAARVGVDVRARLLRTRRGHMAKGGVDAATAWKLLRQVDDVPGTSLHQVIQLRADLPDVSGASAIHHANLWMKVEYNVMLQASLEAFEVCRKFNLQADASVYAAEDRM
jgi:hypothetical protein